MIGLAFGLEQRIAANLAFSIQLAHPDFFFVGQARGHGSGRNEYGGEVAKRECANQQTGYNFVAHPQAQYAVEHIVGECHAGCHGDHITAEQRQLHAVATLGYTVAHGGDPARELGNRVGVTCGPFDDVRKINVGLVRRQHLVVSGDNTQVGGAVGGQQRLAFVIAGCHGVGDIAAGQPLAAHFLLARGVYLVQVALAAIAAPFMDTIGDRLDG